VPCKHNPPSMKLCHAACVCVCACVRACACVCVCVCHEASSHCPPAPLACPLPCTPLLILTAVSRNAGGALCAARGALPKRGADRPASINCKHARQGPRSTATPTPPPALATVTKTPTQTNLAPNHKRGAQEEAQRSTWGQPGTLCQSASFVKPRPPAVSPRSAFPSQHCLMTRCCESILNGLAQKRRNYTHKLALAYG